MKLLLYPLLLTLHFKHTYIYSEGFEVHKSASEKRNLTWIDEMNNFLVDRLMEQMHKGQKIGGVFTKTTYAIVAREIEENFELSCNSKHIKNRMKTSKKKTFMLLNKFYKMVVDLVSKNQLK